MSELTREQVRDVLTYDLLSGVFTWKLDMRPGVLAGDVAGCLSKSTGYWVIRLYGKLYLAHRLAFVYVLGRAPVQVDHENRHKLDNKWLNLRAATNVINSQNRSLLSTNTSGTVGVTWNKKLCTWQAQIGLRGKNKYLGIFSSKQDAIDAREAANVEYGFHKNHGKASV